VADPFNSAVLRLLDANANRAREALRVLEDYARFVLDDGGLSADLKALRHDLAAATATFVADGVLHRDTPNDVGTANKTDAEMQRDDVTHVVTVAGKRLGEALRAIEEYLKTLHVAAAAQVEAVRYRFYDIEHRIALTLRPTSLFADVRLYVLITESACKLPWLTAAERAIQGGADCLQLREKDLDGGELLRRAKDFVALCRRHGVVSIINDRPDVALLTGANGVHVGQGDLPAREVRKLLGHGKVVGVSTHTLDQAKQAVLDGADYVGVGPVFPSPTKPRDFLPGLAFAGEVVAAKLPIPAVAIAGITEANVEQVVAAGAAAVAVTAAVVGADDPRAAAERLKVRLPRVGYPKAKSSVGQAFLPVPGGHSCPPDQNVQELQITRRFLPHWRIAGSTYFLTFRVAAGTLTQPERKLVLDHIRSGAGRFYDLLGAVVMPDHAHAALAPKEGIEMARITKGIKGVSARLLNLARGSHGTVWQDESFDRILRDAEEVRQKLRYMVHNPVAAGLVAEPLQWDALYVAGNDGG